jgi:MFS family permease
MKTKNIFKWPKEIYIFWIIDFILGVELIGSVLLIFFKDWGGLNQTQIQLLQSWFTLWIFILEIPTGVFGDIRGKKFSTILGYIFMSIGIVVYTIVPNIWLFFLAEFIFAMGVAFISGAKEAWMYDIVQKLSLKDRYRTISVIDSNLHMLGMIVAALIFIPISKLLPPHEIFRLSLIPTILSLLLLWFLIPSTDGKNEESLKPKYLDIAKSGFRLFKNNLNLRKLTIYLTILGTTSYFVIWLYQEALNVLDVPNPMFGAYRTILLVAEIVLVRVGALLIKKVRTKGVATIIAVVVASGFLLASVLQNTLGVILLLVFAGGLGLQVKSLLSKEVNEEISSKQRATILSFVSMINRLALTVFNPIIGYVVDSKGVFIAFSILGILSLLSVFSRPKFKLK